MVLSIALVFLIGIALGACFKKTGPTPLLGMMLGGIFLGPSGMGWLHPSLLAISAPLRQIALMLILAKAGFSLDVRDLQG